MKPKFGWNATASERSEWFEKTTLARPKSITPLLIAFALMPVFAWLASLCG